MTKTSPVHNHFTLVDGVYVCHHGADCKPLGGKNSTSTLRHHLNVKHTKWDDNPPPPPPPQLISPSKRRCLRQTSLSDRSFLVLSNASLVPAIASCFAHHSWAHLTIESDAFQHMVNCIRHSNIALPAREAVQTAQLQHAQKLKSELIGKLQSFCRSSPITVAMDGWSNVNMAKVTNVVLLCGGHAYYWCSIVNSRHHNTAAWLRDQLVEVMQRLQGSGLQFAGLVLDNEAVNGALFRLLEPTFPFLIHSPCAAHILQLCVDHSLRLPAIVPLLTSMEALINRFRNNKVAKLQLLQHQTASGVVKPLGVKRPCTTRWSSHLQAAERLVEVQVYVDRVERQPPSFWLELTALVHFLKPFQVATDVLQADSSTLFDTYKVFTTLQRHVNRLQRTDFLYPSKYDILNVILDMWDKHINLNAVAICAHLSFDESADITFSASLDDAQDWFVQFATQYAIYWSLTEYAEPDQIKRAATHEWTSYLQKAGHGFDKMAERVAEMKMAVPFEPKRVWLLHRAAAPIISHAAIAVLCVAGSEAAVERTFSVQKLVHSDRRNRLNEAAVEAEMFIRTNERLLVNSKSSSASRKRKQTPLSVEMEADDVDGEPVPSLAALFQRPAVQEEQKQADGHAVSAAAAPAAAAVAAQPEVVEVSVPPPVDQVEAFVKQFVREEHVTAHYRWSPSRLQVLEGKAAGHNPPIIMHTALLKDRIKQYVSGQGAAEVEEQEAVVE